MAEKNTKKESILSNWVVKNLIWAVVFVVGLAIVVSVLLGIVTQHNKEIVVPDFTNMTFSEAKYNAERAGIRVQISDSVYVRRMKKGAVFTQFPKGGSKVKKGRTILLTTNAKHSKEVTMPLLVGYSMRQAKAELASRGLSLGRLIYVNDIATNNVLRQLCNSREIAAGTMVESGSVIDLVVGLNNEDNRTYAPDARGLKYLRAVDAVHDNSLNVGKLSFDKEVRTYSDSLNAVVYKQSPGQASGALTMGASVSLWLTTDEGKIEELSR
ncbi:MAG: PASTA domain-containing protein [Bacteroidales bacterium]|nr:PASTA domain-containing protein [Bacteroidales bacterium]